MTSLTIFLSWLGGAGLVGGILGALFWKFRNKKKNKDPAILNDPEKLAKALNSNGKIYDMADDGSRQELKIYVDLDKISGKKQLKIERLTKKPSKETKRIQKTKPSKETKRIQKTNSKKK